MTKLFENTGNAAAIVLRLGGKATLTHGAPGTPYQVDWEGDEGTRLVEQLVHEGLLVPIRPRL